jgi:hypothetical protein
VSIVYSLRHQHTVARMMGQGVAATGVGCALGWMGGKALAPLIQKKPPPMSEEMPASAVADVLRALGGPIKPPAWRMKAWREAWARRAREFNSQNCAPSLLPAAMIQGATTTAVRGLLR